MAHNGTVSAPQEIPLTTAAGPAFVVDRRLGGTAPVPGERVDANGGEFLGRTGTVSTPHGTIRTPALVPVGTAATVKAGLPGSMTALGAFMNWGEPTVTDSGGYQVMSPGSGVRKVIDMSSAASSAAGDDDVVTGRRRMARVDEDCDCCTSGHYTRAYLHHLFKAKERLSATLASVHNERFVVRMVDGARAAVADGACFEHRDEFLGRCCARRG